MPHPTINRAPAPGPYFISPPFETDPPRFGLRRGIHDANGLHLAAMSSVTPGGPHEWAATAELFAASWELRNTLAALVEHVRGGPGAGHDDVILHRLLIDAEQVLDALP